MNTVEKPIRQLLNALLVFLFIFSISCNQSKEEKKGVQNIPVIINIQPFTGISLQEKTYVFEALKKVYPHIELNDPIELPKAAYYAGRNRYRADSLINYLEKRTPNGHVTIGLITKDISVTKGSVADWGIMGLGFCPGKACIASTFRLSKDEKLMQLFKVAIHELGHTQGLPHCQVKYCYMRDAEGRNPTNEEKEFCPKCKTILVSKGWQLN